MFEFADEIRSIPMNEEDILVSYDVTALFTNVPLSETIDILVDKAFTNDWFNQTYDLNLEKEELTLSSLKLLQPTNFSSSMVNCMSRLTV